MAYDDQNANENKDEDKVEQNMGHRRRYQWNQHQQQWKPTKRISINKGYFSEKATTTTKEKNSENSFGALAEENKEHLNVDNNNLTSIVNVEQDNTNKEEGRQHLSTKDWVSKIFPGHGDYKSTGDRDRAAQVITR